MSILEEIRPRADHLTNEHSDALLREVINCPAARPRRWWRSKLAAFGLVGVVVAGGTAYAGGLVPSIVSERFDQMTAGDDAWPDPIYDVHLLAETTLSDGTPIRIWRAKTTDGACQIADTTGIQERPEDFGVGCAKWNFGEGPGLDGGVLQACDHHPALVYGELRPPWRGIRMVRVKAQGTEPTWQSPEPGTSSLGRSPVEPKATASSCSTSTMRGTCSGPNTGRTPSTPTRSHVPDSRRFRTRVGTPRSCTTRRTEAARLSGPVVRLLEELPIGVRLSHER